MKKASLGTLHSMTGYGRGSAGNAHASAEVELRTVNGKGLNLKLRLPPDRGDLESVLEARLRKNISRGSVQGWMRLRLLSQGTHSIDVKAVRNHLKEWRKLAKDLGMKSADPTLAELLAMPGSYVPEEENATVTRAVQNASVGALDAALEALLESRQAEGARLGKELMRLWKQLKVALNKARSRVPKAIAEMQANLQTRVQAALRAADQDEDYDLGRELIVLADRADVQEELARLDIHLERFEALLIKGGAVAREIEFLLQEIHREITTLGNKSSDATLSQHVVTMKLVAGQLKEQVMNLE
ncbi:MAG: YicC family protein [Planctomycetes bacterium]|nr:YicC family protein [Planctomycetota bacterium]